MIPDMHPGEKNTYELTFSAFYSRFFNLHQLSQCDINANACMIKSYWKPHTTQCVSWSPQLTLKFYVWVLKMSNISYIMFVRKEAEKHLYNYYGFIKIIYYNEFKWLIIFRYMTNMFRIWTIVNLIHVIFLFFHNEPHFFSFFFFKYIN